MLTFDEAMIGKPFTWRTSAYGDVAVHVKLFSPNRSVAVVTIDGGPDATPCNRFPELSDGTGFAVKGQLFKRVSRRSTAEKVTAAVTKIEEGIPRQRRRKPRAEVTF